MRSPAPKTNFMKKVLMIATVAEVATGIGLLTVPWLVGRLLLGGELAGIGAIAARVGGIALIALGVGCWPDRNLPSAFLGMLTYNLLATAYLAYVGVSGEKGILLWPAVAIHSALSLLLVQAWKKDRPQRI